MRIVCDTNVLVRPFLTPSGIANELLRTIAQDHVLVTSLFQMVELLDVLRRPKIQALHKRDEEGMRRIIGGLLKLSALVALPVDLPSVVPNDPKDDPIVMTAVVGKADVLCTLDHHLHQAAVIEFCAAHGVRVLKDRELLAELRQQ